MAGEESVIEDVGDESAEAMQNVFLGTAARVLPDTLLATDLVDISSLSREQVRESLLQACNNPIKMPGQPGRQRLSTGNRVEKLIIAKEQHADGEVHFHWAIKFFEKTRFAPIKRTLRERDHIASHWSCSHPQWWSALRYLVIPTTKKPEVDKERDVWTWNSEVIDVYSEAQQPWMAKVWKRRRDQAEMEASAGTSKKAKFTKLDLTAIVLEKGLETKTQLLEFTQDQGSGAMQLFVHQNQRKLKELLEDAAEWDQARQAAVAERQTDWDLVCQFAAGECKFGRSCTYTKSADRIFKANETHGLSKEALAVSLRNIIKNGPSKTTKVPILVGPTNTGKTTVIAPFDKVFGFKNMMHKPTLGSKYGLRNILKSKRFLMWDDYRPVQYGLETVPVPTFLSLFTGQPFEVQMSQSFNDGNDDFQYLRGAVMTAKEKDLWKPVGDVDEEDIEHIKTRFDIRPVRAKLKDLCDTTSCPHCMCKWIVECAAVHDSRPSPSAVVMPLVLEGVPGLGPAVQPPGESAQSVCGYAVLVQSARFPADLAHSLLQDLLAMGAVDVRELSLADWGICVSFTRARPLEQRRLLNALSAPP